MWSRQAVSALILHTGKVSHMEHAPQRAGESRSQRTDSILRVVIIVLVAAIIGAVLLFGYTIWQSNKAEQTATPAQRALVELEKFVRKNPNNAAGRVRYGEALASAGMLDEATAQFKNAVKIDEKHTGAWLDLGIVAMQADERGPAERYFTKVVELTEGANYESINQRREQALFHLGTIALDDRRYEDAIGYFKGALRIRRDASDTYYLLAQSLRGMGDNTAAMEQLDAALSFDPNYAEAHYLYGLILLDDKDKVNAAVHLRKAADLKPDSPLPREALKKTGDAKDAVKAAQAALADERYGDAIDAALLARALDPKSVAAGVAHVQALIGKGDEKAAKKVFAEVELIDPKNAEIVKLKAALGS